MQCFPRRNQPEGYDARGQASMAGLNADDLTGVTLHCTAGR